MRTYSKRRLADFRGAFLNFNCLVDIQSVAEYYLFALGVNTE